jgi:hypothetical protein
MPYALFDDDKKLSRDFDTYEAAWAHAEEAGLTDSDGGKTVLFDDYRIEPCEPSTGEEAVASDETAKEWTQPARVN